MAGSVRRGLGWLEPVLSVLGRRYFGGGEPRDVWDSDAWMRATAAALAERLGPALGEACAALEVDVPRRSWAVLAAARLENERRTEAQQVVLRELSAAFQATGIRPVLFKGLALARHYPGTGVRETGDVDLLVAPSELRSAEEVLRAAGYEHWGGGGQLANHYPLTYGRYTAQGEDESVDLHPAWHEVTVASGGHEVNVGSRSEPLAEDEVAGCRWSLLPPAVELYLTAAHAILHSFRTLSVYLDLAVQLAAAEEDALAGASALARSEGRERHLRHAVNAAAELFDLEQLAVRGRFRVPLSLRLGYTGAGYRFLPSSLVMELCLRRGLRRKLEFARWVLGHGGREAVGGAPDESVGRLRRIVRGVRWFKGTMLRYRLPGSSPLRP
jgi:hypothetical protein